MIAGHLQEKKGLFYIVLNYNDVQGKRVSKWISTGLKTKGNKKRAEQLLSEARKSFVPESEISDENILFSEYMKSWLAMVKNSIELTTYASYQIIVGNSVIPYFEKLHIRLTEVQPKHIQNYYSYLQNERGVKANTVKHHHANIRKALQYAVKTDLIPSNPADKVDLPRIEKFVGSFYDADEINALFNAVKGDKVELAVHMAAFYGLRRSEACGLKWSNIDFKNNSITIGHTVTEAYIDGKIEIIKKNRTKNKASHRTLPLVPEYRELLERLKAEQEEHRILCGRSYCTENSEYVYVDELGYLIKPNYITQHFSILLKNKNLRHIRFHDLRHSCASLLLANGVSMKEIQEWLGHSDFATTANIYSHLDYSKKISSANMMVSVIGNKKPLSSANESDNLEESVLESQELPNA